MKYYNNLDLQSITYVDPDGKEQIEEWRDISGYEEIYQVSNLGRIKSLPRTIVCDSKTGRSRTTKEKILRSSPTKFGYLYYGLLKEKKLRSIFSHRAVATAFHPNPENKPQVNHIDGDKSNNAVWNLEWNTASENGKHAYKTGLSVSQKGSAHGSSRLTEEDVLEIRRLFFKENCKKSTIAGKYKIGQQAVHKIVHRLRWKHI